MGISPSSSAPRQPAWCVTHFAWNAPRGLSASRDPVDSRVDKDGLLASLRVDSAALAAAARLGLTTDVPSCPGWSVADLVVHLGAVQRAQAEIVRSRAQEPQGIKREMFESVPGLLGWLESSTLIGKQSDLEHIPPGIVEWFEEGAGLLVDVLRAADPAEPVWSWSEDHTVWHYLRMTPIETTVHRWDAQLAHGVTEPVDRALAMEGIDHSFDVMLPARRGNGNAPNGQGESFRFEQRDGDRVWSIRFEPEGVRVRRDDGPADVTARGTASDLFLLLWRRIPAERLVVAGDPAGFDRYFELVPPT